MAPPRTLQARTARTAYHHHAVSRPEQPAESAACRSLYHGTAWQRSGGPAPANCNRAAGNGLHPGARRRPSS